MAQEFICDTSQEGDVFILRCQGYLDDQGGVTLLQTAEKIYQKGAQKIVINFSATPVVNSPGLAALLQLAETVVEERQGKLALCGLNELTNSVFKMVGLLKLSRALPSEKEAIAALA